MKQRSPSRRLLAVVTLLAFLASFSRLASAIEPDPLTRSVQNALHARGFYYGTVNGRPEPDTVDALRRFQIREGLQVTGAPDRATQQALGIAASNDPAARGASAGPPQDADRELLRREGLTAPLSPPAPTRGADRKATTVLLPNPAPRPRTRSSPSPSPSPLSKPRMAPASAPVPTPTLAPPRLDPQNGDPAAASAFVRRYIVLGAGFNSDAELACFADPVEYFNSGRIKRVFIRRDIEAYHRRWPERNFAIEGEPAVVRVSADGLFTVRFRLAYRLAGARENAKGRTENEVRLRPGGTEGFEIVSIRERKL